MTFFPFYSTLVPSEGKRSFYRSTRNAQRPGDMKKTDMELQAIREKLRLLESEPIAGDVLSVPWSSPQPHLSHHSPQTHSSSVPQKTQKSDMPAAKPSCQQHTYPQRAYQQHTANAADSPQAAVIETLRKRSRTQPQASDKRVNKLVEQEIGRLEIQARKLNERSQQQATELIAMKRSAQQATVALRRQGIRHPQLDTIAQFLDQYSSATVPHLERDSRGQFKLSHTTINLNHAEQEAIDTARSLRIHAGSRQTDPLAVSHTSASGYKSANTSKESHRPSHTPFAQPIEPGPRITNTLSSTVRTSLGKRRARSGKPWTATLETLLLKLKKQITLKVSSHYPSNGFSETNPLDYGPEYAGIYKQSPFQFPWVDGAIWFSAAAIARIVLRAIVLSYPAVGIPVVLILSSAALFSIYRVFVLKALDLTTAYYRLCAVLLGLFIGSAF